MYDQAEETFTYEPTSFVAQRVNINPDSPRHFKNKRRRNNANSKLKHRPQSLIDFRSEGRIKEVKTEEYRHKRSKTVIEKCRGALRRAISMESILDADEKPSGAEKNSSNRSKPITSRLKVRELRKLNNERSDVISYPLSRSKSEMNVYHPNELEHFTESRQCQDEETLIQPRCRYIVFDVLNDRERCKNYTNLNRDNSNSLDSFITRSTRSEGSTTSSPNSSGFYDCTESEHDALSRGDSLSSDGSMGAPHCNYNNRFDDTFEISSEDILFDKDKSAEEKLYVRSWEKNRRPTSIIRNASNSRGRNKQCDRLHSPSSCPSAFSRISSPSVDDVFTNGGEHDNGRDSGVEIEASNHCSPSYRKVTRIKNNNKKQKKKKQKQNSRINEKVTERDICDLNGPLHESESSPPANYHTRNDRRISIEDYVEKLSVSLRKLNTQSPPGNSSSTRREKKKVVKSTSVDNSLWIKRLPVKQISVDNDHRRLSYYGNIRIESVL